MLSVRTTGKQRGRSFHNYLVAAITEHTHIRHPSWLQPDAVNGYKAQNLPFVFCAIL